MRTRRQRNNHHPRQNLDSFLDILTNTVGVLMFIGLFVSLLAVEAGTIIRTPLRSQTSKYPQFFEVRNNQVFYLNDPQLEDKIREINATIPTCSIEDIPNNIPSYLYSFYLQKIERYDRCMRYRNSRLENFYYDNDDYIVTFTQQGSRQYQAIPSSQGVTIKELRNIESEFSQTLQKLSPESNYIAFLVRPDSFAAFRAARQEAGNLG